MKLTKDVISTAILLGSPLATSAFSMIGNVSRQSRSRAKTTFRKVASLDPETKKSQHHSSKIDDELSSIGNPQIPHIAELHSILDDGAGHINADLARSIWQWENSHFHSKNDDPYPAKRMKYSTRDGLRLVDEMAKNIDGGGRYPDLVQEGVVALMRCTVLWDEEHSTQVANADETDAKASFEAFARKCIEEAMTKSLSESREKVGERLEVNLDLLKKRGREQASRIAKGVADSSRGKDESERHDRMVQPLSQVFDDANPTPVEIALSDMIRHDISDFLERKLSELELKIVRLRFGLEENMGSSLSTEEIAEALGLDITQVLELEESALQHLRETLEDDYIGAYFDDDHANEVSL